MMMNNSFDTGFHHNAQQHGGGDELQDHYPSCRRPEDDEEYLDFYNVMVNSFINSAPTSPDEISNCSLSSFKSSISSCTSDHHQHHTTNPPHLPPQDHYKDPTLLYLQDDCNYIFLDHDDFSTSNNNNNSTTTLATTDVDLFPLNSFNLLPSAVDHHFSTLSSNHQQCLPFIDHNLTSFSSTGSSNDFNYCFNSSSSALSCNCFSCCKCNHPKRQKTSSNGSSSNSVYVDDYCVERTPFVDSNPYLHASIHHRYDHFLPQQLFLPPTIPTSDQSTVMNNIPTSVGVYSSPGDYTSNTAKRLDISGGGGVSSSSQSLAARQRRKKITDKTQELGRLIPGGAKMNTADMFHAAYKYVKFLQAQVGILELMAAADATKDHQNKNNKENSSQPLMEVLLASPAIHEKMSAEEKCLVSREFIVDKLKEEDENNDEKMSHDQPEPPSSSIFKDLNSLLLQP